LSNIFSYYNSYITVEATEVGPISVNSSEDEHIFVPESTYDVNLLSKLSIIFKEWRVMNNGERGGARV
jgi:hypothetical protein